eukprot:Gregarina_sp_Pseudo_9__5667@NODE_800_length_2202_cov_10_030513_g753_i0_p1_GENE_NODE_800_length_2202_cov_10_030513_g753_i0NODE_800_length_2202_cov_10_030513_g753_i0_p1_ORF_typecomplete_len433_score48_82TGT/PF01702_18/1_9e28_NODE_800_length_2202_cov_10_030513_g753_i02781576
MQVRSGRKGLQWKAPGLVMTAKRGFFLYMQPSLMTDLEGVVALAVPIGDLMGLRVHLGALFAAPTCPKRPFPWAPPGADIIMTCTDLVQRDSDNITGPAASLKISSEKGRQHLSPDVLLDLLNSGLWDMAILPAEQAPFADKTCGSKRCRRSVQESQYFAHRIEKQHNVPLLANLQGGSCPVSREHASSDLDHNRFTGYYLGGFESHTIKERDESLATHRKRFEAISQSLKSLNTEKTTMIGFDGTCGEVITAVMAGVDLIQVGLPTTLAKLGLMLHFEIEDADFENRPLPNCTESELEERVLAMLESSELVDIPVAQLGLRKYSDDTSPFSGMSRSEGDWKGFGSGYSKAYIHHLLNVREALGNQLLEWHNWRLMIEWFKKLQAVRSQGRLPLLAYLQWFIEANLSAASIHDPLEGSTWSYQVPKQYVAYD